MKYFIKCFAVIATLLFCASTASADADVETVRTRLIASILPSDPQGAADIRRGAASFADSLLADGSWKDIDYANQSRSAWPTEKHLERVMLMARAHRLTPDRALLDKVHLALGYWRAHDFHNPNWWHNEIGVPQLAGTSAVLLQSDLTPDETKGVLNIMGRCVWTKWTGQNLVWGVTNQILRGLIENNADTIAAGYQRLYEEIRVSTDEGIRPDFSFHQHGAQFYSGGYGLAFAQDVPRFASFSWGTRWQIPDDRMRILSAYLLDGEQWIMHGERLDLSSMGREITRKGKTAVPHSWTSGPISPVGASFGLLHSIMLIGEQLVPRKDEYERFAARMQGDATAAPLVGNKQFWCSDYMAHHRPGWFASVKMFSSRMINAELVNSEGMKSTHLSDGANFLYVDGDEYVDILPAWDWTKIPGTTAEQGTLDIEKPRSIGVKGKTQFVGGVSDGTFGLAAMDLARGELAARKAYVFFDDSYVCLGSGIRCGSDRDVVTSVNQCRLVGEVTQGPTWLQHDNVGYIFADHASMKFSAGVQEGRWSDFGTGPSDLQQRNVFNCWIDHGQHPASATYAYEVMPCATPEQTADRAAMPQAVVLSNTADLQAVEYRRLHLLAVAFWKAGTIGDVQVDQPCLLLLRRDGGKTVVSVSNPENRKLTVNVRVGGKDLSIGLPDGEAAGSSVTREISDR